MHFNVREDIIQLTSKWTGERFPDGRPRVPDEDLEQLRKMTLEEIWMPLLMRDTKISLKNICISFMMTENW